MPKCDNLSDVALSHPAMFVRLYYQHLQRPFAVDTYVN